MSLLLGTAVLAAAAATEIEPPEMLIKGNAGNMREGPPWELRAVDFSKIRKANPVWTEASLKALFRSIDPEKIKYADGDRADGDGGRMKTEVTLIEPRPHRSERKPNQTPSHTHL